MVVIKVVEREKSMKRYVLQKIKANIKYQRYQLDWNCIADLVAVISH